jgi:hypothetical protein
MLSLELSRLVHEERQKEIEETHRVRALSALLQADRPVSGAARRQARLVAGSLVGRHGALWSR